MDKKKLSASESTTPTSPHERLALFQQMYYPDKREFCWRVGISDSTFSRLTRGMYNLRAENLIALQQRAGCSISWFLVGEGPMLAPNEAGDALRARDNG